MSIFYANKNESRVDDGVSDLDEIPIYGYIMKKLRLTIYILNDFVKRKTYI
jgi:hypothetical protein